MILTQSSDADPLGHTELRGMFEARKQVFVDLLKWDVPVIAGRFEVDQFDDAHARYLIVADPAGAHLGSARLLPTTRPHILEKLFADLCAGPVPTGADIAEITQGSHASAPPNEAHEEHRMEDWKCKGASGRDAKQSAGVRSKVAKN